MEWIIGLIVVWLIWRFTIGKSRRNSIIQSAIEDAYINNEGQDIKTNIYYEAGEKFAEDRGFKGNGAYITVNVLVNGITVKASLHKSNMDGMMFINAVTA